MSDEELTELSARVRAIEARQRAAGIHDPWCPVTLISQARLVPIPVQERCCCWLSEE